MPKQKKKIPNSVELILKEREIKQINNFDSFDHLINNSLITIKNVEVTSLCKTIFNGVIRNGFESGLSSSLIMLFSTIDEYYTLIKDKNIADEMEHQHYSQLLSGVEAEIRVIDILAKQYQSEYDELKSQNKNMEAFQIALLLKKQIAEKSKLMKEQYRLMVAITTRTYKVSGEDLTIKRRQDLLLMRTNIIKLLSEFNLTPKTMQVTPTGVKSGSLAEFLNGAIDETN